MKAFQEKAQNSANLLPDFGVVRSRQSGGSACFGMMSGEGSQEYL